jgi:hypothetical protein
MSTPAPQPAKKSSAGGTLIGVLIILGLAFFLPQYICNRASSFAEGASAPPIGGLTVGYEGTLEGGENDAILITFDAEAYTRLSRAAQANDRETLIEMLAAERVAEVPSTTKVRVLDIGTISEVRILDGEYANRTAFVSYEFVE